MRAPETTTGDARGRRGAARAALPVLLAGILVLATGCVGISGPRSLALQIENADGVELDRVFGIDVGGTLANLALSVASHEAGIDLAGGRIDRVEVGIYELKRTPADGASLFDGVGDDGWTTCVRVRGRGQEEVRVLIRADESTLSGVAVLVRDRDEVVIARVRGDLAPFAESAVRLATDEARREMAHEGLMRRAREARDGSITLNVTDRDDARGSHAM